MESVRKSIVLSPTGANSKMASAKDTGRKKRAMVQSTAVCSRMAKKTFTELKYAVKKYIRANIKMV